VSGESAAAPQGALPEAQAATIATLIERFGVEKVCTDLAERQFFSQDVFRAGHTCIAIVRPTSVAELSAMLALIHAAKLCVTARGGGLSYTDAYLPSTDNTVMLDLRGLDRITEINATDGYVVVETGVTWAALAAALAEKNLRTPYWGPLSGLYATVGGALSQGSTFLGSGRYGAIGESVLALELLKIDGSSMRTGSWAADATTPPNMRYFGPDLTGLFIGDAGALAVKTRVSLRLLPAHSHTDFLSFSCADFNCLRAAMSAVTRMGLASECFGFDPVLATKRMQRASLVSDVKTLGQVIKNQGMLGGLKVVAAGRNFLDVSKFSFHLSLDADSSGELSARLAAARRACAIAGVAEIENSIPKIMRSQAFTPPNAMLGPKGERWVPVHGVVAHSRADAAFAVLCQLFSNHANALSEHSIDIGYLLTTVGAQGFLIEPVFYWPDAQAPYHERLVEPQHRARLTIFPPNPAAKAAVERLKKAAADCLRSHGATHFQLGKFYCYRTGRDPAQLALLDAIKSTLDPHGLLNPGALAG
jgi:FAD/FMN-containing dehydrogenase